LHSSQRIQYYWLLPRGTKSFSAVCIGVTLADNEQVELLREVRDLLRVIAEPALAKRDERLRISLTTVVGKSKQKAKAVLLMDGSRNQLAIREATGMDPGNLSRLAKELRSKELIGADDKPKLVISIPPNFFEDSEKQNG